MNQDKSKIYSKSLSYHAWERIKRNRLAVFGMFMIACATLIALLGPYIRPDFTPKANNQILEITTQKPGFEVAILNVRKNNDLPPYNFFKKFTYGEENLFKNVPIYDYKFEEEFIVIEKYTGYEKNDGQILKFNLANVVYPIDRNQKIRAANGNIYFTDFYGNAQTASIDDLRKKIETEQIVEKKFYLGTDKYGRDLLSRLMAGTWVSLSVGFISVFISLVIGIFLGAIAGYYRGWVDDVIMWFINVVWSVPTLLFIIAITLALGKDFWQVFVAVGLTMWVEIARVVRGQVLGIREKEFVEAGKALGFSSNRIIFKHIIPNVLGSVIVISAMNFAAAILIEAGLSYLGIGAQPPQATWGKMIAEHKGYITTGNAYLAVFPGIAIILMVLAFILVGNGLRDALDSKSVDDIPSV